MSDTYTKVVDDDIFKITCTLYIRLTQELHDSVFNWLRLGNRIPTELHQPRAFCKIASLVGDNIANVIIELPHVIQIVDDEKEIGIFQKDYSTPHPTIAFKNDSFGSDFMSHHSGSRVQCHMCCKIMLSKDTHCIYCGSPRDSLYNNARQYLT